MALAFFPCLNSVSPPGSVLFCGTVFITVSTPHTDRKLFEGQDHALHFPVVHTTVLSGSVTDAESASQISN